MAVPATKSSIRISFALARHPGLTPAAASLALFFLNVWIAWRLFFIEYLDHFSSIEGAFIALARYIAQRGGNPGWLPWWHCGMSWETVYLPGLHVMTALFASAAGVSAPRAYHILTALAYAAGAGTLFFMARALKASLGLSLAAGVTYSVFSFSAAIMPQIRADMLGYVTSRRLQVLTVYGEGPHVASITLLPLVILALQRLLERRSPLRLALASAAVAAVLLVNVPGTMAMMLWVACWLFAQSRRMQWRACVTAAAALALGLCLAAPGFSASFVHAVLSNLKPMHPGFSKDWWTHGALLAGLLLSVWAVGRFLEMRRVPLYARFGILACCLLTALVVSANPARFELLPQVGRLHLELDAAFAVLAAWLLGLMYGRLGRKSRVVFVVVCLIGAGFQAYACRKRARIDLKPANISSRSEYQSAMWVAQHLKATRVYAPGSTAFWLNSFVDTPQLTGCCEQGWESSGETVKGIVYMANLAESPVDISRAIAWLQIYGVSALIATGPASTETYKDLHDYTRFAPYLRTLHEGYGDIIYEIPGISSLAHVLSPDEVVLHSDPVSLIITDEIARYVHAVTDSGRAAARLSWLAPDRATIEAQMHKQDVLSLQIAYSDHWRALVNGAGVPTHQDRLGMLTIEPSCEGDCTVTLQWSRGIAFYAERVLSLGVAVGLVVLTFLARRRAPQIRRISQVVEQQ